MTEEPDPMIPVIIGECLYDLRSALDHLAVAMAPRRRKANAAFPVETTDPWEKDAAGIFVYPDERRQSFTSKIKGIPADAVEMIMKAQPYQREGSELETLSPISRLENADKHRTLIAIGHGVVTPAAWSRWAGKPSSRRLSASGRTALRSPSSDSGTGPRTRARWQWR
jgi:hypothetical protein